MKEKHLLAAVNTAGGYGIIEVMYVVLIDKA